jgi:hypothetical protein
MNLFFVLDFFESPQTTQRVFQTLEETRERFNPHSVNSFMPKESVIKASSFYIPFLVLFNRFKKARTSVAFLKDKL